MVPQILFSGAYALRSAHDVAHYIRTHLMDPSEAGALLSLSGYLDNENHVVPVFLDRNPWEELGLSPGDVQIPPQLVFHSCQGMDLHGAQVAQIAMYSAPKEFILTVHCETSEALERYPEVAWHTLHAMAMEALAELESRATRVRIVCGEREWRRAKMLAVLYIHGRNSENEPHFHGHLLIFPIVQEPDLGWRVYQDGESFLRLNTVDGLRSKVGAAARREVARHGFQLTYAEGLASFVQPNGATVVCPDGQRIEAGSVIRKRTAMILAHRHLKQFLGVPALTKNEVRLVQEYSGQPFPNLPRTAHHSKFLIKLRGLELLDEDDHLLSDQKLALVVRSIDESMARAQASVMGISRGSKPQRNVLSEAIESKRMDLVRGFPELSLQGSTKSAKIKWTAAFTRTLEQVAASGTEGLSLEQVGQEDSDTFLILLRTHLLTLKASEGRRAFLITEYGERRLSEVQAAVKAASDLRYEGLNHIPVPIPSPLAPEEPRRKCVMKRLEPNAIEKEVTLQKKTTVENKTAVEKEITREIPEKNHSR